MSVASADAPATAEGPLIAGRYRVERVLGKGGMGAVHAAVDTTSGRRVALKRMLHASPRLVELFKREWQTLHGLRHGHIVEVYDFGRDADGAYYTMELLEGADLSHAAPMPWREVCACLRDVASILGVLHARRLLHRDLSPKNLWRLPNGTLKLIDFGALAPFGRPVELVGTPPFIAPEALRGSRFERPLDQRADLYSLGALGYFLLTGRHAYPAHSIAELPELLERAPHPAALLVRQLEQPDIEPIPDELDALIGSLLRLDPFARPTSTEALIDRLGSIASLPDGSDETTVQGYLRSKAFVGRRAERARIEALIKQANQGHGQALLIEVESGMGGSRLLEEASVLGRLAGATTVRLRATPAGRPYEVMNQLVTALHEALPDKAAHAAQRYRAELAHAASGQRVGHSPAPAQLRESLEMRLQVQRAFTAFISALAQAELLSLVIDDLQYCDEESAAWLAGLALEPPRGRFVLVASLQTDVRRELGPGVAALRDAANRMPLAPLNADEVTSLLQSMFGAAPYLEVLAQRLFEKAGGRPGYTVQLATHLVDTGAVSYAGGSWSLPRHVEAHQLPESPVAAQLAQLERVSTDARALARVLSVAHEPISQAQCMQLAELDAKATEQALVELTLSGVLREDERGYRIDHGELRAQLDRELPPEDRQRAQRRLGEAVLAEAGPDLIERLRAATLLLRGGERMRAKRIVLAAFASMSREGSSTAVLTAACPFLEQIAQEYQHPDCNEYDQAGVLALLGIASYVVDYRFARKYGDKGLELLQQILHFDLARRMRPLFGAKLSMFVALTLASIGLMLRPRRALGLFDALRSLVALAAALNGVAASTRDAVAAQRCQRALAPFEAFGMTHIAGFMQRAVAAIGLFHEDRQAATMAELRVLADYLEAGTPILGLTPDLRSELLAGMLLAIGILECWRESPAIPELADRLAQFGPLHAIYADRLRVSYFAGRGRMTEAQQHRDRVDAQAVLIGATWQLSTFGPFEAQLTALWTRDAMLAKRSAREVGKLARELVSLQREVARAQATHLVLRRRYREVVQLLEPGLDRSLGLGCVREHGLLASAYNGLGEHEKARDTCRRVLGQLSDEDLQYVVMTLHTQIELAMAESGLGQHSLAREQLDALLTRHDAAGPLTLGALHRARAKVALAERDFAAARVHAQAVAACYEPIGIEALHEQSESLQRRLARAIRADLTGDHAPELISRDEIHSMTSRRSIASRSAAAVTERAARALQLALQLTGADRGLLVCSRSGSSALAFSGSATNERELVAWARRRLSTHDIGATVVESGRGWRIWGADLEWVADARYGVLELWSESEHPELGALGIALGFSGQQARYSTRTLTKTVLDELLGPEPSELGKSSQP